MQPQQQHQSGAAPAQLPQPQHTTPTQYQHTQHPPIAEHSEQQQQQQPAGSSSSIAAALRGHTNRPSRLSAVLVPASPPGAAHSPPPSPPAATSGQPRPVLLGPPPKSPGSESKCVQLQDGCQKPLGVAPAAKSPGAAAPAAAVGTGLTSSSAAAPAAAGGGAGSSQQGPSVPTTTTSPKASTSRRSSSDGSSEGNDEGSEWGWDSGSTPWYCRPKRVAVLVMLLVSAGLVLAGLVLQVVLRDPEGLVHDYDGVFPWLYFFAAFPPLFLVLRWLCWRLYTAAEYTAIREELYFLRPLRSKLASLLFWMTVLLWFQSCFNWLWCHERCEEEAYQQALLIVWRVLVCITLFAAANFLKCCIARLLSYSFYKTAHFEKVRLAVERELYLIRLSQARSSLLPSPPEAAPDIGDQQDWGLRRPGAWGSTLWLHKTSQAFLGGHSQQQQLAAQQGGVPEEDPSKDQEETGVGGNESVFARPAVQQRVEGGGMRHVASADRIVEDAAVHVQVRQLSEAMLRRQQPPAGHSTSGGVCASKASLGTAAAVQDKVPLLQQQQQTNSCPAPKLNWPQADMAKPHHAHQQQQHSPQCSALLSDQPARQQSYELFAAERVPSILGMQQRSGSRTGSKASSKGGSRLGQQLLRGRNGSKYSSSKVSLPGMVAGVDGLLLQPEVLGAATAAAGQVHHSGKPVTEEELGQLRLRLGVNTFGTFVDRYYGMSAKEEAAHVRQVKRFAKGLFANVLGDADRDHILPEDFLLFFDGDEDSAHDAFAYFDRNGDGSISCTELQESAAEMLCERKNIAASIKDTDSVVNSLESGLGMLIHFLAFAVYLLVWGVNIVKGFTTFSATALALTFVFGDSVKGVFESAIYLFVTHPYDVGDALWFPPGQLARVKKIDLQYTVLARRDGQLVWHPNSALRMQPLVNLSRSNNRWEAYTWLVDLDTPDEVLTRLADALAAHVASSTQRAHFACNPAVTWRGMEDPLKMRLAVGVTYSFTGEDTGRYVTARHGILSVVRRELHSAGVRYTVPVQQQTYAPIVQQATTPFL